MIRLLPPSLVIFTFLDPANVLPVFFFFYLKLDLYHRLGIHDNSTIVGMCTRPRLPPIQCLRHKAIP